jgi:hypothetical protein
MDLTFIKAPEAKALPNDPSIFGSRPLVQE